MDIVTDLFKALLGNVSVNTQPLTEMSIRNLPGGKGTSTRKADNLIAICEPIV
jgi:hypothetical protein